MTRIKPRGSALVLLAALVATSGALAGCSQRASTSAEETGRTAAADTTDAICAAPSGGSESCVPATQDPSVAWGQAAARGGMPITMRVAWPAGVSIDQVASSKDLITRWSQESQKVLAFVRDSKKSAESYRASLAATEHMAADVKNRQTQLLAQKPSDPVGSFKQAMLDKANAEKGPINAELASDKQTMGEIKALVDRVKGEVTALDPQFKSMATQFQALRATETAAIARYTDLSQQASQANLDALPGVEALIVQHAHDQSAKPNDLELAANQLAAQIRAVGLELADGLSPYAGFLATHQGAVPDMTTGALRSLDDMVLYMQDWRRRSDAIAQRLLDGTHMRRDALVALKADLASRQTLGQSALLAASKAFVDEANARIAAVWATPAPSTKLKLQYYAARHDQLTAFLQLEPLCAAGADWREAGCIALRRNFNSARAFQEKSIPALMKGAIATMRAKGVDPALLDAALAKITAGDVRGATVAYDLAVQASESLQ